MFSHFRADLYDCLYARSDAIFELTDAVLCADGPVKTLVELSLAVEHRREHEASYAALDRCRCEPVRLRRVLRPPHRNSPARALDDRPARRTSSAPGATTSARPSNAPSQSGTIKAAEGKRQPEAKHPLVKPLFLATSLVPGRRSGRLRGPGSRR